MSKNLLLLAALALPFAMTACSRPQPAYYPPPPAWSEIARHGFHDGIEAARRDIAHGAPPDVNRHPRFRNPPVPPPAFEDYRHGFREGYQQTFRRGPGPGPGYY
jgi:hypothetical protein